MNIKLFSEGFVEGLLVDSDYPSYHHCHAVSLESSPGLTFGIRLAPAYMAPPRIMSARPSMNITLLSC